MGAHESNRGLCAALFRMYRALGCQVTPTEECAAVIECIAARHCKPLLAVADAEANVTNAALSSHSLPCDSVHREAEQTEQK
jgi:hypothetical protein